MSPLELLGWEEHPLCESTGDSGLSLESVFHSVINAMLMLKKKVSLGENTTRKKHISCKVHPKHAKPLCTSYGFAQ